jgi:hypothetical protein
LAGRGIVDVNGEGGLIVAVHSANAEES